MQGEGKDNGNLISYFDFNSFQPFVEQSILNIANYHSLNLDHPKLLNSTNGIISC